MSDQNLILDGNVEKMAEALKDSDMIKATQLDGDKDQSDLCAASSAGDETQSAGVIHDELPVASITVKGMYNDGLLLVLVIYYDGKYLRKKT